MNRREFLSKTAASAALVAIPKPLLAEALSTISARFTVQTERRGYPIPRDFLGLSYESAQLAHPEYFSSQNKISAGFMRALGSDGVLRIGGNTSEFAIWTPHPSAQSDAQIPAACAALLSWE